MQNQTVTPKNVVPKTENWQFWLIFGDFVVAKVANSAQTIRQHRIRAGKSISMQNQTATQKNEVPKTENQYNFEHVSIKKNENAPVEKSKMMNIFCYSVPNISTFDKNTKLNTKLMNFSIIMI